MGNAQCVCEAEHKGRHSRLLVKDGVFVQIVTIGDGAYMLQRGEDPIEAIIDFFISLN